MTLPKTLWALFQITAWAFSGVATSFLSPEAFLAQGPTFFLEDLTHVVLA
jgi:hypothetical protein